MGRKSKPLTLAKAAEIFYKESYNKIEIFSSNISNSAILEIDRMALEHSNTENRNDEFWIKVGEYMKACKGDYVIKHNPIDMVALSNTFSNFENNPGIYTFDDYEVDTESSINIKNKNELKGLCGIKVMSDCEVLSQPKKIYFNCLQFKMALVGKLNEVYVCVYGDTYAECVDIVLDFICTMYDVKFLGDEILNMDEPEDKPEDEIDEITKQRIKKH